MHKVCKNAPDLADSGLRRHELQLSPEEGGGAVQLARLVHPLLGVALHTACRHHVSMSRVTCHVSHLRGAEGGGAVAHAVHVAALLAEPRVRVEHRVTCSVTRKIFS